MACKSLCDPLQTELLINGYNREQFKPICAAIVQCEILYFNGDEGIPTGDPLENNNNPPTAQQHKVKDTSRMQLHSLLGIIPPQYLMAAVPIPTRQQFCTEIRNHHNVTRGIAIKAYKYICGVRAFPVEGTVNNIGSYQFVSFNNNDSEQKENVNTKGILYREYLSRFAGCSYLHLFVADKLIKTLRSSIEEKFESEWTLYHYLNMCTLSQINDHSMMSCWILEDGKKKKIYVVQFDLHCRGTYHKLYGIITPNLYGDGKMKKCKWLWILDRFLITDQQMLGIYNKHRLVGLINNKYIQQLKYCKT